MSERCWQTNLTLHYSKATSKNYSSSKFTSYCKKHRKHCGDSYRSLSIWKGCVLCVAGSPVGANLIVPAQHSRVQHAAGSSAQNLSGRGHKAASKPREEHWQRSTGKTYAQTNQLCQSTWEQGAFQTHMVQSIQSLYCNINGILLFLTFLSFCHFLRHQWAALWCATPPDLQPAGPAQSLLLPTPPRTPPHQGTTHTVLLLNTDRPSISTYQNSLKW